MNTTSYEEGARSAGWLKHLGLGLLLVLGSASAQAGYEGPQVRELVGEMVSQHGFSEESLLALFARTERQQKILDAISRPAERVRPWKEYRPIFLTEARIKAGARFWAEHAETLARAEAEYGVPARFIVGIIGVETFYGRITGSYRVMDALSTLGFDYPPRQPFFRDQLKQFLLLTREQQIDPLSLKGSYAGAMGLPQFMPGSFRSYAVDFDHDGHIDIWNNPADAIGSVASYFKAHGWVAGAAVASRARVTTGYERGVTEGLESKMTAAELRESGWSFPESIAGDLPVIGLRFEGSAGDEFWVGLPNFYVITRYNHSAMYAMAVKQLADAVQARRPGEQP